MKTRRNFLVICAKIIALFPFVLTVNCTKKEEEPNKNLLSEDNETAKIFKYKIDGTGSEANSLKTNHDAPVDEQICKTCNFYKAIGDDYGDCQILKGNVTANGWCTSWAKKILAPAETT